jgi:phosphonate metabolism protein PhnN/1,5-bisphosphokinase (PRPP-forming)
MFILVVGPSGAGKDTILSAARRTLADDPAIRFVRRVITRPADPENEDHEAVTDAEFDRREFALQWDAHGLRYGIPLDVTTDIAAGRLVIANVSRAVIADAAARFPVRVLQITAPPDILAMRLAKRGRETAGDVAERIARNVPIPAGVPIETIVNDSTPEQATQRFIDALGR